MRSILRSPIGLVAILALVALMIFFWRGGGAEAYVTACISDPENAGRLRCGNDSECDPYDLLSGEPRNCTTPEGNPTACSVVGISFVSLTTLLECEDVDGSGRSGGAGDPQPTGPVGRLGPAGPGDTGDETPLPRITSGSLRPQQTPQGPTEVAP